MSMLRLALLALLSVSVFGFHFGQSQAEELEFQPSGSKIVFVGSKPDGKHEGGFKKFEVTADANFEEPTKSTLSVEIDARSLWSDNDKLTNHLKSPDFFDVRSNPKITFESTKIVPGEKEGEAAAAMIVGKWQMLGKTVEVEVPIEAVVTEESVVIEADFTIDRTKWGMTYGQGKINNDVKVTARLAFKR